MNCLVSKMKNENETENSENTHLNFPEPEVMFSNCFLCLGYKHIQKKSSKERNWNQLSATIFAF